MMDGNLVNRWLVQHPGDGPMPTAFWTIPSGNGRSAHRAGPARGSENAVRRGPTFGNLTQSPTPPVAQG